LAKMAFSQINTAYETMLSAVHSRFADYYKEQLPEALSILNRLTGD